MRPQLHTLQSNHWMDMYEILCYFVLKLLDMQDMEEGERKGGKWLADGLSKKLSWSRPTFSQLWSSKICRTMFPN